jgi:hypothetical protein
MEGRGRQPQRRTRDGATAECLLANGFEQATVEAVASLKHVSRAALAVVEADWAVEDVVRALRHIPRERWFDLRPTMDAVPVRGSGGGDGSFGAVARERTPTPRWAESTRVDELLRRVEAVEVTHGTDGVAWSALRAFCEREAPPPCRCPCGYIG